MYTRVCKALPQDVQSDPTECIDIHYNNWSFQIHWPDPGTPIAEVVRTMDELVRCGKVRYPGACKLSGWQMQKLVDVAEKLGCNPWVTLQVCKQIARLLSDTNWLWI